LAEPVFIRHGFPGGAVPGARLRTPNIRAARACVDGVLDVAKTTYAASMSRWLSLGGREEYNVIQRYLEQHVQIAREDSQVR
jgi:hypothetical protein